MCAGIQHPADKLRPVPGNPNKRRRSRDIKRPDHIYEYVTPDEGMLGVEKKPVEATPSHYFRTIGARKKTNRTDKRTAAI